MFGNGQISGKVVAGAQDNEDYAEFLPHLEMLYGVAWHFTRDARKAELLIEQALVAAVIRKHTAAVPSTPKMALLSALREAYVHSSQLASPSPAGR